MNDKVIVLTIVTGGVTLIRQVSERSASKNLMKTVIGTFILTGGLLLIGEGDESLAEAMALLVATTSVLVNGAKAFTSIERIVT